MSAKLGKLYREVFSTPAGRELLDLLIDLYLLPTHSLDREDEGKRQMVAEIVRATGSKPSKIVKEASYVDYDPEEI